MLKFLFILAILLLLDSISKTNADGGDAFEFLEDGETSGNCFRRLTSCEKNTNACCDGLVCTELTQNFSQCLPAEDDSPVEPNTTKTATFPPSLRPVTRVKEKSNVSKRNLWFYRIGSFLMLCSLAAVIVAVVLDLKERRIDSNTNNLEVLDGTCKTLEEP